MKIELENNAIEELHKMLKIAIVNENTFIASLKEQGIDRGEHDDKSKQFYERLDAQKMLESLVKVVDYAVNSDTGGSRVCRHFVVNLYNSYRAKFDIVEMNNLDIHFYNAFLDVMDLNRLMYQEVHHYIKNGTAIFEELAQSVKVTEVD